MNDLAGAAHAVDEAALPRRYAAVRALDRASRRIAERRGPVCPVDARCQSGEVASRAHDVVLRTVRARPRSLPGYQVFDRDFALSVQLLLRGRRPASSAAQPRAADAPVRRTASARSAATSMPRCCGCWRGCRTRPTGLVELGLQHEQQHQELLLTDMLHAFAQNPLAPAVLPDWREPEGAAGPTRFVECAGGMVRIGHRGRRLLLRQRDAGAFGVSAAVSAGVAAGAQRRMAGVHRRRRLPHADAVDVGRLGVRAGERLVRAAVLARERRRLVADGTVRPGAARSRCAGAPHKLVRGRRVRALGRRAAADRGGVGGGQRHATTSHELTRMSGNGHAAPTAHIRGIGRSRVRSANTTASS